MACLVPALSPRLACHRLLVPAPRGLQAHGRAALMRSCTPQRAASSLGSLACDAAAGLRVWRLAAAAEPQAVAEQSARTEGSAEAGSARGAEASSKLVLVVGGTGGVGQLVVASLLSRNIKSRLLLRDPEKAVSLFGKQDECVLQVYKGDTRNPNDLDPQMFEGVTHVICCTGTTAFPSKRWDGDNTPERVDWDGIRNLVNALPRTIKRLVFVSSIGVTKYNDLPWSVMNLFGVLKYKKMAEDFVHSSGIPFTIIRPGRLTDGPYTSYDLNTLLKATAGERRAVVIGKGDKLVGEVSRLVVAEACIQALDIEFTEGQIYEINSVKERLYGKEITVADREMVEERADQMLREAADADVAFLVVGDPFGATTHTDLVVRAKKMGVEVKVIHNASVMNAIGVCGLQLYHYGETISIPFFTEAWRPDSFYKRIQNNRQLGLHTLCLLDIRVKEPTFESLCRGGKKVYEPPRFMTVNTAISQLLEVEEARGESAYSKDTLCIGVARLGSDDQKIVAGPMERLLDVDFGPPLHCLIIVGETHPLEEEMIEFYMIK